jgi:pilus assembly protein CpaF
VRPIELGDVSGLLAGNARDRSVIGGVAAVDAAEVARRAVPLADEEAIRQLSDRIRADLVGAGPLEDLLAVEGVSDVLVNGPDEVFLDRGRGLEHCPVRFANDAAIRALAGRLAAQAGRRLDDSAPYVDAALPDGTRLHAILPPLVHHPAISLRVLSRRRMSVADLVAGGSFPSDIAEVLRAAVFGRLTLLISGGTGCGKTSLLAALLSEIDPGERIITVEDAPELAVDHPHVVALMARNANAEKAGAVTLADLVRQALRMRGDRIVVGEFRGSEILELLAALNTGHCGGAATVHANSLADLPSRLVALGAFAGIGPEVTLAQARSALQLLAHLSRRPDGSRYLAELGVWQRDPADRSARRDKPGLQLLSVWHNAAGWGPGCAQLAAQLAEAGAPVPVALSSATDDAAAGAWSS